MCKVVDIVRDVVTVVEVRVDVDVVVSVCVNVVDFPNCQVVDVLGTCKIVQALAF